VQIKVNGQQRALDEPATLADLLSKLGLQPHRVAVECNKVLVRRRYLEQTTLTDGDEVEIVTLVGGG